MPQNLDILATEFGARIASLLESERPEVQDKEKLDSTLSNALDVLREQGICAMFLQLLYRSGSGGNLSDENKSAFHTVYQLKVLMDGVGIGMDLSFISIAESVNERKSQLLETVAETLRANLRLVEFLQRLLETALSYARYAVKAMPGATGVEEGGV